VSFEILAGSITTFTKAGFRMDTEDSVVVGEFTDRFNKVINESNGGHRTRPELAQQWLPAGAMFQGDAPCTRHQRTVPWLGR